MTETVADNTSSIEQFQVYIRLRPPVGNDYQTNFLRSSYDRLYVQTGSYDRKYRRYDFNRVFDEGHNNSAIFEGLSSQLDACLDGYNVTLMAYGVTGSGKTHTIFGGISDDGLAVRCCYYLLKRQPASIKLSYIYIYNYNVRDLLIEGGKSLNVMEDAGRTVVQELTDHYIRSYQQLKQIIAQGNTRRVHAATSLNEASSRSHAILQLTILTYKQDERLQSRLTIIDLAGSYKSSRHDTDKLMTEGCNINKSLLALGNCITALADKRNPHIPYRDSKLTRILKEGLSGNSRSIMIACISSNPQQFEYTLNTILYASRATRIRKRLSKNVKYTTVECPSCRHRFGIQYSSKPSHVYAPNVYIEELAKIDMSYLKNKVNSLIEQSILIGRRNPSPQQDIYDMSIVEEVFDANRATVFHRLEQITTLQKCISHHVLIDQKTLRRDSSRKRTPLTSDNNICGQNVSNFTVQNGECKIDTQRRLTLDNSSRPYRQERNSLQVNHRQIFSKRTSRQHSNISYLSGVDNTPTLRMKRDSLDDCSPRSEDSQEVELLPIEQPLHRLFSGRLSLKHTKYSKRLKLL